MNEDFSLKVERGTMPLRDWCAKAREGKTAGELHPGAPGAAPVLCRGRAAPGPGTHQAHATTRFDRCA